jgi:ABC-type spermidine/putrescine transport system permease subunit I
MIALLGLFLWPAAKVISGSVTEPTNIGLGNFVAVLSDPTFSRFAANTLRLAVLVSLIAGTLGYFYAYAMYGLGRRWRVFLMICVLFPFSTSLLVRSFAWSVILRDTGIVNWVLLHLGLIDQPIGLLRTSLAITIGMTQILLPFTILPTYSSMTKFDPDLLYAARSMGASAVQAFWLVFFPCTRVGLMAGLLLVFLLSLGYYITPVLLGGPGDQPVAVLINSQVVNQLNWGLAGSMSAIVIAAVLLLLAAGWHLVERVFLADR